MKIDIAKGEIVSGRKGVLSRCKVCGRYFTWNCPTQYIYTDLKTGKEKSTIEPEHCGSSVCKDFWDYYEKARAHAAIDLDYAKVLYLKRKGVM
jgi:hypothetical protein